MLQGLGCGFRDLTLMHVVKGSPAFCSWRPSLLLGLRVRQYVGISVRRLEGQLSEKGKSPGYRKSRELTQPAGH